jgi:hypothetical protein
MTIIKTSSESLSPEELTEYMRQNIPVLITNFLTKPDRDSCIRQINSGKIYNLQIFSRPSYIMTEKIRLVKNKYIDHLFANQDILTVPRIRMWRHKSQNLTPWHYDQSEVFNIVLKGKKRFFLSPPDSIPTLPFANFAVPYDFTESSVVDVSEGDTLIVPTCWFHKVLTLEDHTTSINYLVYFKTPKSLSTRHTELYALHNIFNTYIDQEVLQIYKNKNKDVIKPLLRGVYEASPILLIFIIIYITSLRYKKLQLLFIPTLILGIVLFSYKKFDHISSGILKLLGFYIILFSAFFITLSCYNKKYLNI